MPLIDMFLFVCDQVDSGIVTLDQEQTDMLADAQKQMNAAKAQLSGTEYDATGEWGRDLCVYGYDSGSGTGILSGRYGLCSG